MSSYFKNKKILFCGPKTFNYEREIVSTLERMGARVVYISDRPWEEPWRKVVIRTWPKLVWASADRLYRAWVEIEGPEEVDIVLVIKGEGLSPTLLSALRTRYPTARFVLYLWDSIANVKYVEEKLFAFDTFFSFDAKDCQRNPRFKYRPLFFLDSYRKQEAHGGEGCFFLGTLNGDRPKVIAKLLQALPACGNLDYWLFVRSELELRVRSTFDSALRKLDPSRLLRTPMSSMVAGIHMAKCAAVIDIEHPRQSGLTMRTFEVLAFGKKLITTNQLIMSHEFYDSSRVCVIDRESPSVPGSFFSQVASPLREEFFARYSIEGWLNDVIGEGTAA